MTQEVPAITHEQRLLVQELRYLRTELQEIKALLSKQEEKPKRKAVKKDEGDSPRKEGK